MAWSIRARAIGDRITRLAFRRPETPMAPVSRVAEKCQWFKSAQGLRATDTPRAVFFCGHAILAEESLMVEDATQDEPFVDNPLVIGEPRVRFYAGHPLRAENGSSVGTQCVIDHGAR